MIMIACVNHHACPKLRLRAGHPLFFSTQQCVDREMNRALLVRSAQDEITSTITLEVNAWEMEDNHAMGHWRS